MNDFNRHFDNHRKMMRLFFVIFCIAAIFSVVMFFVKYQNVKETIKKYECVPTESVTQEFRSNSDGSFESNTKVYYKCKDRGRWLPTYDTLDAIFGNE